MSFLTRKNRLLNLFTLTSYKTISKNNKSSAPSISRQAPKNTIVIFTAPNGRNEQAYHLLLKCAYYAKVMQRTYIDIEVKLLLAITQYRMGEKKWDETLGEALTKAEEYHFVRIITREGAAIRPLLQATSWKPSEVEKDLAQTRKNKQFWAKVQDETEKMARFYPAYLKVGVEEVTLSDTMLRILKLQADGMSKEKIAAELNMTTANVKYHTQQIYKRLGVSNKAGAVMEAGKRGLI